MSVWDSGDDIGPAGRPGDGGKDIADPAGGAAETRGGESPADWAGPLPVKPRRKPGRQAAGDADWCGHPRCGGDL
jgi:hypothetical protein